ncbi:MAG: hypothetical protein HKL84_02940 [Acidimicrobiaceae bacterium]|nr:hypothetical protein [Acidimicrobiaceae bacterium]
MLESHPELEGTGPVPSSSAAPVLCELVRWISAADSAPLSCICGLHENSSPRDLRPEVDFMRLAVYWAMVDKKLKEFHEGEGRRR